MVPPHSAALTEMDEASVVAAAVAGIVPSQQVAHATTPAASVAACIVDNDALPEISIHTVDVRDVSTFPPQGFPGFDTFVCDEEAVRTAVAQLQRTRRGYELSRREARE